MNWQCVNSVANADYSTNAGTGVAGVSGTALSLTNGSSYVLPSGGGGGGATSTVVLRSGSLWVVPNGVSQITVELYGGGGGSSIPQYKGGSGGGYCKFQELVTAGNSLSYAVGSGGGYDTGQSGGTTSWQGGYYATGGAYNGGSGGSSVCAGVIAQQSGSTGSHGTFGGIGGAAGGPMGQSYGIGGDMNSGGSGNGNSGAIVVTY